MRKTRWLTAALIMTLLGTLGSFPAEGKKKKRNKEPQINRVWPPPPQQPRIKLLQIINGEGDVVQKKKRGMLARLVGDRSVDRYLRFLRPYALAGDSAGRLYVADTYLKGVLVMDPTERDFYAFAPDSNVRLRQPLALQVDSRDNVWVADGALRSILCFDAEENLLLMFGTDAGRGKRKIPTLERPAGLALDEERNRVYVSDAKLHQVFVFDMKGKFLARFGGPGPEPGQFAYPGALLVDGEGRLLVTDTLNGRVQVFDPDLKLVQVLGGRGDTPGHFGQPKSLAVDSEGHIYVTDAVYHNFQIFGRDSREEDPDKLSVLMFVGESGRKPGDFRIPGGIYINSSDQIFVADQMNGRIQVFQFLSGENADEEEE